MKKRISLIAILIIISTSIFAKWDNSSSIDEMTGEKSAYCSSAMSSPTKTMSFPYTDVRGWIGIGADGKSEWAYVGFTDPPNLLNTETRDGYNRIRTRIKFDDTIESIVLTQNWGAKFLHFSDDEEIIKKISESNTVLLELDWHGSGSVYFRFSLDGSSAAIKKMRAAVK